jgi:anti-sigma regulatory factor (Ser/Thr protein kinase)
MEYSSGAPHEARRAVRQWLDHLVVDAARADDLVLVVSELVTNAVVHARSPAQLIATADDGRVRVEVHDHDPSPPRPRTTATDVGGFGLPIVEQLTDGWGWTTTPSGKYVWTETLL